VRDLRLKALALQEKNHQEAQENLFKLKEKSSGVRESIIKYNEASIGIQNKVANALVEYYKTQIGAMNKK
jgi:hypothetical protein